jgi:hypothetical protein
MALALLPCGEGERAADVAAPACMPSRTLICNTVRAKSPNPLRTRSLPSISSGLSEDETRSIERAIALAIARLPATDQLSAHLLGRLSRLVIGASTVGPDEALVSAFGTGSPANAGYAGGDPRTLRTIVRDGNLRERWALVYVLQKNHYIENLFDRVASDEALGRALGVNTSAVRTRALELEQTKLHVSPADRFSNGIADWLFPPFASWVRFDFDAPAVHAPGRNGSREGWVGCRQLHHEGCHGTNLTSDDVRIFPPLSSRELEYQCAGASPPCALHWQPGASCYSVLDTPIGTLPGYAARARRYGYRTVAGPSGTTANTLQLGALLGSDDTELLLLRATMASWLILSRDHSLWEVLLGAEVFVPPAAQIGEAPEEQPAVCQLGRLLPSTLHWRGHTIRSVDVWAPVVATLRPAAVWVRLGHRRQAYLSCLATAADPGTCCEVISALVDVG